MKRLNRNFFWDVFFWIHPFCLHAKFQVWYSTPSRFVKKMTYFCIIFAEKYFLQNICGFTPAQKNSSKFDQNWANASQLTYSAMGHLFFLTFSVTKFLSDPGIPSPIYGSNSLSQTETPFADLTDVTLVMKIPTQYEVIMTTGQSKTICGNACDKIRWPSIKLLQVVWWPILKPMQIAWPSP